MARPVVLWVHISQERDGEKKEGLIIPVEMVSELLQHLDTHQSLGLVGTSEELPEPLFITIYQQSWLGAE